jgi:hypothetical protein
VSVKSVKSVRGPVYGLGYRFTAWNILMPVLGPSVLYASYLTSGKKSEPLLVI